MGGQRPEAWRPRLGRTVGAGVGAGAAMPRDRLEAMVLAQLDAEYGSAPARGVRLAVPGPRPPSPSASHG